MLEALGLSTAESQVYQRLVGSGRCPVDRLEQRTGLTGTQLEQAVAALAVKGLVTLTDDLPAQMIPAPPDIAGETLLLARMNELQSAKVLCSDSPRSTARRSGRQPWRRSPKSCRPRRWHSGASSSSSAPGGKCCASTPRPIC
ncbi:helix-turn-helix domain-containing protein [Streptomyces aureus]